MEKENGGIVQDIYEAVQNSEKMLKLLLANELIDEIALESIGKADDKNVEEEELHKKFKELLKAKQLKVLKTERLLNKEYVFISVVRGIGIRDVIEVYNSFINTQTNEIPVFYYEKINGNHRKALIRQEISFSVKERETHLYEW